MSNQDGSDDTIPEWLQTEYEVKTAVELDKAMAEIPYAEGADEDGIIISDLTFEFADGGPITKYNGKE